ncbi:MAG: nicotinate-nucleotide--dimethylbenzimidazole phosphoribosyltransferase [Rhodospirillales bacterium]
MQISPDTLTAIREMLDTIPGPDESAAAAADNREPQLTKPPGALGRLEKIARWAATWQGRHPPTASNITVRIFAGNHGVTARGVSAFPAEVTHQMVGNFAAGGAAINQLCRTIGAHLDVIALDLDIPTGDFSAGPAMSDAETAEAFSSGMAAIDPAADLLCIGEMGIGNTTSAAALAMAIHGGDAVDWTGPGTGVSGDALKNKAKVVAEAVIIHTRDNPDGLALLARLGGRELAAMAGAILAARLNRVPVVLDGYVATAAAAALKAVREDVLDHCVAGHVSQEPGHRRLLDKLSLEPILDLGMRLGEGSGAALAAGVVRAAVQCHGGMATFAEAGVSDKDD